MRFKKTRWDKRGTYTYVDCNGRRFEVKPGADGVTEADIKMLYKVILKYVQ